VVEMGPCVEEPEDIEATGEHRPEQESDDSGPARRPGACAAVVNYPYRE
jgi:hypothetical protein